MARWLAVVVALGGLGCEAAPRSDAGVDAGPPDVPEAPADAPSCDAGAPPSGLPALEGTFEIAGADGGLGVPSTEGGDPVGVWRFEHVTIIAPAEAEGMIDAAASEVAGTGWVVVEASTLRMVLDLDITLETTVAGTVRRAQHTSLVGAYSVASDTLLVEVECVEPIPDTPGAGFMPRFDVEGDRGTLVLTLPGMAGTNTIVLTGTRTAT
jgi:hypothetical protein